MTGDTKKPKEHHIWCNYFMKPVEDCKMCEGLREKYPEKDFTLDELMLKHFSSVISRNPPKQG